MQKIDAFLEREQGGSNAEMIRRMGAAYFADVDALEKSGELIFPKYRGRWNFPGRNSKHPL